MLKFAWWGLQLQCPACRKGRIFRGLFAMNHHCKHCGAIFEREEGDFVGAMVVAYSITAVIVVVGIFAVELGRDLTMAQHAWLWSLFAALFLILTYRNMKGIWIGILHAMVGLQREDD